MGGIISKPKIQAPPPPPPPPPVPVAEDVTRDDLAAEEKRKRISRGRSRASTVLFGLRAEGQPGAKTTKLLGS